MITFLQMVVSGAVDVGAVVLRERDIGNIGTNVSWSYYCFQLKRFDSDHGIFLVNTMNRKYDVIDTTSDLVCLDDFNHRPAIFIYWGWSI